MTYTHDRSRSSDIANKMADELCDLLNEFSARCREDRRLQIEAGTAPALPWHFDLYRLDYVSMCANSAQAVFVVGGSGRDPSGKPCPSCKAVHPLDVAVTQLDNRKDDA